MFTGNLCALSARAPRNLAVALVSASLVLAGVATALPLLAQSSSVPARVTEVVDRTKLVTLRGNVHPFARPEYDLGAAPDDLPMERILLMFERSPEQEAGLRDLLDQQQVKSSPSYHHWLTPNEFGEVFGPADSDVQAVSDWLASEGFQVNRVGSGRGAVKYAANCPSNLGQAFGAMPRHSHSLIRTATVSDRST